MEKFIRIAESIDNLTVFNAYEIGRLDIQRCEEDNQFHAFLTLRGTAGDSTIDFHIKPDGSFYEIV